MNFRRSPTSVEILTIIATCTEVPRDISKQIIGSSRTIEDNFRFLVREKYISKMKPKKGVTSYRLTQKGKKILCDPQVTGGKSKIFEEYFMNYAPELCGNQKQILRLHKQAEIIVALHNATVHSFVGEKFFLSNFLSIKEMGVSPYFFNSQELKKCFARQDKFASASRTIGTILTPNNIYFVYNSGKYPINFSVDQERKAFQTFCETIIKKGFVPTDLIIPITKALLKNSDTFYINAINAISENLTLASRNYPSLKTLHFPHASFPETLNNSNTLISVSKNDSIHSGTSQNQMLGEPNSLSSTASSLSNQSTHREAERVTISSALDPTTYPKNENPPQVNSRSQLRPPRKPICEVNCEATDAPASQSAKPSSFTSAKPLMLVSAKPPQSNKTGTLSNIREAECVNIREAKIYATYTAKLRESLSLIKKMQPEQFIKEYVYGNVMNIERERCDFPYIESIDRAIEKWVINYCNENKDAIVFGEDWNAARRMLEMSDDYMAKTLIQPKNGAYNTMRYIPNTREGEETLEIIMKHAWKERMLSRIVPPEDVADGIPYETGCDLYTKDHLACYCMIDMDLSRLVDIKRWLMSKSEEEMNYEIKIICFTHQSEILKEWFGRLIDEDSYVEISIEDAKEIMEETREEFGEWSEALKKICKGMERLS